MNTDCKTLEEILLPLQKKIENKLLSSIEKLGAKNPLRDACEYALLNGGKRFRPSLVYLVAKSLETNIDVTEAAIAVEYFHTASLIADDLPCMDNDDERRSKPSLHKAFGESTALLASYALIAAGYELLAHNVTTLKKANVEQADRIGVLAVENVSLNTGLRGASLGQCLDINPPSLNEETIKNILHLKTGTLFEISFVLGWAFGGGDLGSIDRVKKAAYHLGQAFQIADDFGDVEQDIENQRDVNLVLVCGKERAIDLFHMEIKAFKECLKALKLESEEFEMMIHFLQVSIK